MKGLTSTETMRLIRDCKKHEKKYKCFAYRVFSHRERSVAESSPLGRFAHCLHPETRTA